MFIIIITSPINLLVFNLLKRLGRDRELWSSKT